MCCFSTVSTHQAETHPARAPAKKERKKRIGVTGLLCIYNQNTYTLLYKFLNTILRYVYILQLS
jgi:hypothetical protein